MLEKKEFLTEQIITYLGNKRALLSFIDCAIQLVRTELHTEKIDAFDVFSGSGVVARYLKQYCNTLYVNDLEDYIKERTYAIAKAVQSSFPLGKVLIKG